MTLRVGILTYDFVPFIGGQGRVTHDLWRRLRERDDVDITVISPARNDLPDHFSRFAFTQRVGRHLLFSLAATASARRWARELRLNVLHVNGGPGGVLLLADPGVPVVYSLFHTYEQTARLMPGHRWKGAFGHLERAAYARAEHVIASTASTARSLREMIGVQAPLSIIPCGVDSPAFPRLPLARDEETVLFVGRLDDRKHPQLLVRAFAQVLRARPDARLVLVGRGPLEKRLRALAARFEISRSVSFEHFVDHDALVSWYNRAALVVVPSLFEGFGLSAVEAQSCGACVVATDSEGLRDVIRHNETGVLAPPQPEAISTAITELLNDAETRERLGEAAAAHVRTAYRWDAIIERMTASYQAAAGTSLSTMRAA